MQWIPPSGAGWTVDTSGLGKCRMDHGAAVILVSDYYAKNYYSDLGTSAYLYKHRDSRRKSSILAQPQVPLVLIVALYNSGVVYTLQRGPTRSDSHDKGEGLDTTGRAREARSYPGKLAMVWLIPAACQPVSDDSRADRMHAGVVFPYQLHHCYRSEG